MIIRNGDNGLFLFLFLLLSDDIIVNLIDYRFKFKLIIFEFIFNIKLSHLYNDNPV